MLNVLIGCEFSGAFRDAFIEEGHVNTWSCDIQHKQEGKHVFNHIKDDVRNAFAWKKWDLIILHPDCTYLTNSGSRWLFIDENLNEERWGKLFEACDFYRECLDAPAPFVAVENPVMHSYAREIINPAERQQVVQPWWFGDPFFKGVGWHLKGLPLLKPTNRLTPPKSGTPEHKQWSAVHRAPPGPDRAKIRSRSYPGMAQAAAKQWGSWVSEWKSYGEE